MIVLNMKMLTQLLLSGYPNIVQLVNTYQQKTLKLPGLSDAVKDTAGNKELLILTNWF